MNRFRKLAIGIIIVELIIIALCNVLFIYHVKDNASRNYRVECLRVAQDLESLIAENAKGMTEEELLRQLNLSQYKTVTKVELFDADAICNSDYYVEEVAGKLYRICYSADMNVGALVYMNVAFGVLFLGTILTCIYVDCKFIVPFYRMSDMTMELAKGNLTRPIKAEKSKFFGKFLWGMDMLRENLEANKEKELDLQKEKKGLLLSLSHDIKTPLSAIELYNKALTQGLYDSEEKKKEAYEGIERNICDIKNYVDEIIQAAREDFLNLEVVDGEFYLSSVMQKIEGYYKEKLGILHTDLVLKQYEDCLLKGDEDRYVEVLQNIMENAIKYGDGKYVHIEIGEEEDCKLIQITSSGATLPEEELPNIFDSFYRGSNTKGQKGSGLGLYICRNLMRKMDGDIFANIEDNAFSITVVARKK